MIPQGTLSFVDATDAFSINKTPAIPDWLGQEDLLTYLHLMVRILISIPHALPWADLTSKQYRPRSP